MTTAFDDPLAPAGEQFPLGRPDTAPLCWDKPSLPGVRTWGLRRMGPVMTPSGQWLSWGYDHQRQLAIGPDGVALLDLASGPPTAPTTQTVDGEDPPSSEDWVNDYTPDPAWQDGIYANRGLFTKIGEGVGSWGPPSSACPPPAPQG